VSYPYRLLAPHGAAGPQDTITGFLLAGVGHVDLRKTSNFLVVDGSEILEPANSWRLRAAASWS
jgi:vacuolar-type H+-ATPase subunit F/Vma7